MAHKITKAYSVRKGLLARPELWPHFIRALLFEEPVLVYEDVQRVGRECFGEGFEGAMQYIHAVLTAVPESSLHETITRGLIFVGREELYKLLVEFFGQANFSRFEEYIPEVGDAILSRGEIDSLFGLDAPSELLGDILSRGAIEGTETFHGSISQSPEATQEAIETMFAGPNKDLAAQNLWLIFNIMGASRAKERLVALCWHKLYPPAWNCFTANRNK